MVQTVTAISAAVSATPLDRVKDWPTTARFTISHSGMDTTIVGTLQPEDLEENIRAAERGSPQDVYAEARRRLAGAGVRSGQ